MQRDITQFASTKLQGGWSAAEFGKHLTKDNLRVLLQRFDKLEPLVRVRLLLACALLEDSAKLALQPEIEVRLLRLLWLHLLLLCSPWQVFAHRVDASWDMPSFKPGNAAGVEPPGRRAGGQGRVGQPHRQGPGRPGLSAGPCRRPISLCCGQSFAIVYRKTCVTRRWASKDVARAAGEEHNHRPGAAPVGPGAQQRVSANRGGSCCKPPGSLSHPA